MRVRRRRGLISISELVGLASEAGGDRPMKQGARCISRPRPLRKLIPIRLCAGFMHQIGLLDWSISLQTHLEVNMAEMEYGSYAAIQ
ncbi:hypothetical protein BDV59DRAFT_186547 [Aspergillus ambiguus]|uniref:uncharacterized protein n=1 Tax=Aspergillus ambiguus TaxID=176160 RepID=UPI003CCD3037